MTHHIIIIIAIINTTVKVVNVIPCSSGNHLFRGLNRPSSGTSLRTSGSLAGTLCRQAGTDPECTQRSISLLDGQRLVVPATQDNYPLIGHFNELIHFELPRHALVLRRTTYQNRIRKSHTRSYTVLLRPVDKKFPPQGFWS